MITTFMIIILLVLACIVFLILDDFFLRRFRKRELREEIEYYREVIHVIDAGNLRKKRAAIRHYNDCISQYNNLLYPWEEQKRYY